MLLRRLPTQVAAAAVYPYSRELMAACRRVDRFDNEYYLCEERMGEAGLFRALLLPRATCPESPVDLRADGIAIDFTGYHPTPRNEEQRRVLREASTLLHEGKSFILQAPTGWGKTVVGCWLIGEVGRKALIITTKEDIVDQWVESAEKFLGLSNDKIGIWRGDVSPDPDCNVVVGLVQSLLKGPERYPDIDFTSFGFVICDEVHRIGAEQFSKALWHFPAKLRMGLSATPYRKDGRDEVFTSHIGPVSVVARQETMVPSVLVHRTGWKVPMVYRYGRQQPMPHDFGKTMHLNKFLAADDNRNQIISRFVHTAYKKGRNTIVFADTVAHLKTIYAALGLPKEAVGYYVGLASAWAYPERGDKKHQREKVKLKPVILATYAMASEATDIPWLDTCVLASPKADVVQIVGRIRREYEGKRAPVVLDLVDDDSEVFSAYANKRLRWYRSIGCAIKSY